MLFRAIVAWHFVLFLVHVLACVFGSFDNTDTVFASYLSLLELALILESSTSLTSLGVGQRERAILLGVVIA